jgi:hypothetical protein
MNHIEDIKFGMEIAFTTHNPRDGNVYRGKVKAICDYETALKTSTDISAYYSQVATSFTHTGPKEELTYAILNTGEQLLAFALEWIDETSLIIGEQNNKLVVTVYNVDPLVEKDNILNTLRAAGYYCNA